MTGDRGLNYKEFSHVIMEVRSPRICSQQLEMQKNKSNFSVQMRHCTQEEWQAKIPVSKLVF